MIRFCFIMMPIGPRALLIPSPVLGSASPASMTLVPRAGGWFASTNACGPGDNLMSDIVNISSIAVIEEETFADYMTRSVSITFENSNKSAISGSAADAEICLLVRLVHVASVDPSAVNNVHASE
ncbi:hypothetical protein D9758_007987 [Tetrapyrgos nigripes]|uniref:Secreted protein n=1 Tax=Tetrapyrgos nigripes TaxID=182062 RepID=A0A8H5FWH5_9AGAR|nr:hypothetical protein D9758_007987 [Tetrapyrgos nigripes]